MILKIAVVACGGAIGSVLRLLLSEWTQKELHTTYPYGTMVVNLIGALVIGLAMSVILQLETIPSWIKFFLVTGILGGFTTFSTFAYETVTLLQQGDWSGALFYGGVQLIVGLLLCFLGLAIGRFVL